jgi:hypothetical protein
MVKHNSKTSINPQMMAAPPQNGLVQSESNPAERLEAEQGQQAASLSRPEIRTGRSLAQILIILVVLLVLVNIPINYTGFGLAHLEPDTTAMVIDEGMLLKGSGPEIYALDDYKLRLISNPQASGRYFRLNRVRTVEDHVLAQFGQGPAIRYLVKCSERAEVYALEVENGRQKRLVENPPLNSTKPWDQIHSVACTYLRNLPDGPSIPE